MRASIESSQDHYVFSNGKKLLYNTAVLSVCCFIIAAIFSFYVNTSCLYVCQQFCCVLRLDMICLMFTTVDHFH